MRTVTFIPRAVAERTEADADLLISITHPGEIANVQHWPRVLRIQCDDIAQETDGLSLFHMEQAREIIEAIKDADSVVVHCEAGMSRSAAVATWLADNAGFKMVTHANGFGSNRHLNKHIYRTLDATVGNDMTSYYAELERKGKLSAEPTEEFNRPGRQQD